MTCTEIQYYGYSLSHNYPNSLQDG